MMKIDYELVEKIGANCYMICDDGSIGYFRIYGNNVYVHSNETGDTNLIQLSIHEIVKFGVKPIPPKPPVRVEYEKVNESIFDLKDEFERGELYFKSAGDYYQITNEGALCNYALKMIYRRIEKPVDWRDEVSKFVNNADKGCGVSDVYVDGNGDSLTDDAFLEMCRVALRANGEL